MSAAVNIAKILAILSLAHFCYTQAQDPPKEQRCQTTSDCLDPDKVCYEGRCICSKGAPAEDELEGKCYPLVLMGERCYIQKQCMVNSLCIGGYCNCGEEAVAVYNPSSKIFYCQPKRRLNEECNSETQCPVNAYCSRRGCLCSNGFGPHNVSLGGQPETTECLAKACSQESDCPEYHQCDEKKCKCLATHFDIDRARCYKFGGTSPGGDDGGDQAGQKPSSSSDLDHHHSYGDDFISTLKDLTSMTSDKLWLVLIILVILSPLLLILVLLFVRKHYLGYCWTAHKKEYEPNTAKQQEPRNGHFDKNSINNKSFRRRNGESDCDEENNTANEDDSSSEDKSNLVGRQRQGGEFVAVNLSGHKQELTSEQRRLNFHQQVGPLKSSISTPV